MTRPKPVVAMVAMMSNDLDGFRRNYVRISTSIAGRLPRILILGSAHTTDRRIQAESLVDGLSARDRLGRAQNITSAQE